MKAKVDSQGRLVVPQAERRRLGIDEGGSEVNLVPTAEGIVLEPSRDVTVTEGEGGLRVATIGGAGVIRNATVLEAIHADRAQR